MFSPSLDSPMNFIVEQRNIIISRTHKVFFLNCGHKYFINVEKWTLGLLRIDSINVFCCVRLFVALYAKN